MLIGGIEDRFVRRNGTVVDVCDMNYIVSTWDAVLLFFGRTLCNSRTGV